MIVHKLTMLLALASAGRSSELNSLNCKYMKLQDSFIHFELTIHTKTCRSGSDNRKPSFDSYKDDPNWCAVSCINHYINRTKNSLKNLTRRVCLLRPELKAL
jgi:hypothetical protein